MVVPGIHMHVGLLKVKHHLHSTVTPPIYFCLLIVQTLNFKKVSKINFTVSLWLTLSIVSIYSIMVASASGYSIDLFSKDESPFGIPYDVWVAKYWNWTASIPIDPETNTFANLKENGCLIHEEDSVIMLVDPAVGGKVNQICQISSNK
jgi:hypothetical protein